MNALNHDDGEQNQRDLCNNLCGKKVLLVEDNADMRFLICHMLQAAVAEVKIAVAGEHALELAFSSEFDVILMDIHLPGINGFQTTAELRRRGCNAQIIALSAQGEIEEQCRLPQFDSHMAKPVRFKRLIHHIASRNQKKKLNPT